MNYLLASLPANSARATAVVATLAAHPSSQLPCPRVRYPWVHRTAPTPCPLGNSSHAIGYHAQNLALFGGHLPRGEATRYHHSWQGWNPTSTAPIPTPGLQGVDPSTQCYHCDPQAPDIRLHVVALLVQLRVYSFWL